MKKVFILIPIVCLLLLASPCIVQAQCSICAKTAAQMGEEPARGLNKGILYLAFTPLLIAGFVGYRWWKREKQVLKDEQQ